MVQSSVITLSYARTSLKEFRKIHNNNNNNSNNNYNNILLLLAEMISDYSLNDSPTVG